MKRLKCAMFAGEPSADALGGALMQALKKIAAEKKVTLEFCGIGGVRMQSQGLKSLLAAESFAFIGWVEVLRNLPILLMRLFRAARLIRAERPDLFVSIDMAAVSLRLTHRLRALPCKKIHYVAPSVWLSRSWRAKRFARAYDAILTLFPFEPRYFTRWGGRALWVGHPIFDDPQPKGSSKQFRSDSGKTRAQPIFGLFFGSRRQEIATLAPVLLESARMLSEKFPDLHFVAPTLPSIAPLLQPWLQKYNLPVQLVLEDQQRFHAMKACRAALAVAGTISYELAVRHIPHAICYRLSPITFMLAKRLYRTEYANLVNYMQNQEILREFLQERATAKLLFDEGQRLLGPEGRGLRERLQALYPRSAVGSPEPCPAARAAAGLWVLAALPSFDQSRNSRKASPPKPSASTTANSP